MNRTVSLQRALTALLAVLIALQPLSTAAQERAGGRAPAVLAGSPGYEALLSGFVFEALRGSLPQDYTVELVSYEVALRDDRMTDDTMSGSGTWTLNVRYTLPDATTRDDTLRGNAQVTFTVLGDGSSGSDVTMQASLSGEHSQLSFVMEGGGRHSGSRYRETARYTTDFVLDGTAYPTLIERTEDTGPVSFDASEIVRTTNITRDGVTQAVTSRLVSRTIDEDHFEHWVTAQSDTPATRLEAHLVESLAASGGFEYAFLGYELTAEGELVARLDGPGSVRWTPDGLFIDMPLVDGSGRRLDASHRLTNAVRPMETALADRRFSAGDMPQPQRPPLEVMRMPLFGPCGGAVGAANAASSIGTSGLGAATELAHETDEFVRELGEAGISAPRGAGWRRAAAGNLARQNADGWVRGGATGLLTGIVTGIIANDIKNAIADNPNLSPAEVARQQRMVDIVNWAFNTGVGLFFVSTPAGAIAAILVGVMTLPDGPVDAATNALADALAGGLCNGDPYFAQPDRRRLRPASDEALRLLFVQNGVYAMPPPAPPEPDALLPQLEFRDNPRALLAGAAPATSTLIGRWQWDQTTLFQGLPSHRSSGSGVHYFIDAPAYVLPEGDELIQYVYIDPQNPPQQFYLQVYTGDGDGERRAFWGENLAQTGGTSGTASLYPMGPIPPAGQWLRLRIPVSALALGGEAITGLLFGTVGGQMWWGTTTSAPRSTDTAPQTFAVSAGSVPLEPQPGAQVGIEMAQSGALTVSVLGEDDALVATLYEGEVQQGFHTFVWDGTDASGAAVTPGAYRMRIATDSGASLDVAISTAMLEARLLSPGAYAVVRGTTVPIVGLAGGEGFAEYIVEYGEGAAPQEWTRIFHSDTPASMPRDIRRPGFAEANLAIWNTGLDEFGAHDSDGLHGLYTLRLRVIGQDGSEISDSVPVVVGRLAAFGLGNTIPSPDGAVTLTIPPGAARESFVLLGILPVDEASTDAAADVLPAGVSTVSRVYEILPAEDTFMVPVTLEIATPDDSAFLLLGDGTPEGWRRLESQYDAARGVLTTRLTDFGGGQRALVGAFRGDPAGFPRVAAVPPLPEGITEPLFADSHPVAFYEDFIGQGAWFPLDAAGTQAEIIPGTDAGLPQDRPVLRVTRTDSDGARFLALTDSAYDAQQFPIVVFDYRLQPGDGFNLLAHVGDHWVQVDMSGVGGTTSNVVTVSAPRLIADGQWHRAQIDLYRLLRDALPEADRFFVQRLAFGQLERLAFEQMAVVDRGLVGSAYEIGYVTALRPVMGDRVTLALPQPADRYTVRIDGGTPLTPDASRSVPLPDDDGFYLLDVAEGGELLARFPVLADSTRPILYDPSPAQDGVGSPFAPSVRVQEATGLSMEFATLWLNGVAYDAGVRPLEYDGGQLHVHISRIDPVPPLADGDTVRLRIDQVVDYAGNALLTPFEWSFSASIPRVQALDLRQLSENGGIAPVLHPLGEEVAYTTSAGMVVQAVAPDSIPGEPTPAQSGMAWSRDGSQVAVVRGGTLLVGARGEALRPLVSAGLIASPSWSPDGRRIAVVVDGNVALADVGSGALTPLTDDTDRPYRAVAYSPDGAQLALAFDLYERRIERLSLADGVVHPVTEAQDARDPAWLNDKTILYTAPAPDGRGTRIWQVQADGSGARVFDLETPDGTSDEQAVVSADGGTIAFVSTRGGQRDVWLKRALQIAAVQAEPAVAMPGQPVTIRYTLPAAGVVELEAAGVETVPLLAQTEQARGAQAVTWDTTGRAEGVYRVTVLAVVEGVTLRREVQVRLGEPPQPAAPASPTPAVQPTPSTPPAEGFVEATAFADARSTRLAQNLLVQVFTAGTETEAARSEQQNPARLSLPAGSYDVVLSYTDAAGAQVIHRFDQVVVEPNQTVTLAHPAAAGSVTLTTFAAPQVFTFTDPTVRIYPAGDSDTLVEQVSFLNNRRIELQEGRYDIELSIQTNLDEPLTHTFTDVAVTAGRGVPLSHIFPTARVSVSVERAEGVPAEGSATLLAFAPGDRETPLAEVSFTNPLVMTLPASRYDFALQLRLSDDVRLEQRFDSVALDAGQTLSLTHVFPSGRVQITALAAPGVRAYRDPRVTVYAVGDRTTPLAGMSFTNPLRLLLPAGRYDFVLELENSTDTPQSTTFSDVEIAPGADVAFEQVFPSARVEVTASAAPDVRSFVDARVVAYATGNRTTPLAQTGFSHPLVLVLPEGCYDLVLTHRFSTEPQGEHLFADVEVSAGARLTLNHVFPSGRVQVAALRSDGTRLPDPQVTVYAPGDRSTPLAEGRFSNPVRFVLPEGRYDFVMNAAADSPVAVPFVFENVDVQPGADVTLSQTFDLGTLTATALTPEGQRIPGARLTVRDSGGTVLLEDALLAPEERVVLPVGTYIVSIRSDAGTIQTYDVVIRNAEQTAIEFRGP